jgi:hypothetical protein
MLGRLVGKGRRDKAKVQPVEGALACTSTYWGRTFLWIFDRRCICLAPSPILHLHLLVLVLVVVVVPRPKLLPLAFSTHPSSILPDRLDSRADDTGCLVTESCRLSLLIVFS